MSYKIEKVKTNQLTSKTIPPFNYKNNNLDQEIKKTFFTKTIETENDLTEEYIVGDNETIEIFDNSNKKSNQYGGNQMDFFIHINELLKDEIIINKIREYYPDATLEDCEYYLKTLSESGCGYVACVNSLFIEYQGKEKEFEETFGFPMYTKNEKNQIDFNYEYLILDFFNYVHNHQWNNETQKYEEKRTSIEEVYGNKVGRVEFLFNYIIGKSSFTSQGLADNADFSKFLKEKYNIECNVDYNPHEIEISPNTEEYDKLFYEKAKQYRIKFGENFYNQYVEKHYGKEVIRKELVELNADTVAEMYKKLKEENQHVIINCKGYNLYKKGNPLSIQISGKDAKYGHVMYITGVAEDGKKLIVSSWGDEYILDLSKVEKRNGYINLTTIKFKNNV